MEGDENEDYIALNNLPYEIIAKILAYLPVNDRNNARLACSSWHSASKDISILKHQIFVYNGTIYDKILDQKSNIIDLKILSHMLETSEYNYINLKFQDTYFDTEFEEFVTTHAARIYSLSFVHCTFPFSSIEKAMLTCYNLKELYFEGCNCISNKIRPILKMNEDDVIRKNLFILIFIDCDWVTDYVFALFMDVYPNVKELFFDGIRMNFNRRIFQRFYGKLTNDTGISVNYTSDSITTFGAFCHTIKNKCKCIEKLGLGNPALEGISSEDLIQLASLSCLRLKEVKIHGRNISPDSFQLLFTLHPNLTAIDIYSMNFNFSSLKFMLSQCPNLERLIILFTNSDDDHTTWDQIINLLAKSRLKYFEHTDIRSELKCNEHYDVTKNYNLSHLTVSLMNTDPNLYTMLLKTFCNLIYLNLDMAQIDEKKGELTSLIFKNQRNLKTLILNQCHWIDDCAFEVDHNLKKLERLELIRCNLTDISIKKFDFPSLKVLKLDGTKITDYGIAVLPLSSPRLEHVSLNETDISERMLLQFCQSLKFLKRLQIMGCCNLNSLNINSIPHISKSLRVIRYTPEECYFYNYYKKKFLRIEKSATLLQKFFQS